MRIVIRVLGHDLLSVDLDRYAPVEEARDEVVSYAIGLAAAELSDDR